ncbi:GNAT family N-acetyltransferase [Oxalobacteraceae bacterium OTU3REALA1]|nr:GNAT family N-acetyltransferase [Oxalobacteraceae bacterium OTU3REALA1]
MYLAAIRHEKTLCHSKAFAFVLRQFAALVALGHAEHELPFSNQSQVTYGLDAAGAVIAASVHAYDPAKRAMWLQFSAVEAAHRRNGAYRELFAEVCKVARGAGAVNVYAGVATDNHAMLGAAKRLGREPVVVRYKFAVGDAAVPTLKGDNDDPP